MPGPPAKRNAERRRRNKESQNEVVKTTGRVPVPVLPKTAHAIARRWYLSLKTSAQSQFFEPRYMEVQPGTYTVTVRAGTPASANSRALASTVPSRTTDWS